MPLPQNTSGGIGGGDYFKAADGNTKLLILADPVDGYEYWTADVKPVRQREQFEEPLKNPKMEKVKVKNKETGVEEEVERAVSQKYFWTVPVYNFTKEAVEVWQIPQKGIRDELVAIQSGDWGDPVGNYTVTLNKTGSGFDTKYKVTPNKDNKDTESKITTVTEAFAANPIDIEKMMFGA